VTRWALHFSRYAVDALYHRVERAHVEVMTAAIKALAEDPTPAYMQPSENDPSTYWVAVSGDYIVTYEIVDERHVVRVLDIE
jgi:mRNA-degrading endonuclease RelE of RelBE toxin-antitoxin system